MTSPLSPEAVAQKFSDMITELRIEGGALRNVAQPRDDKFRKAASFMADLEAAYLTLAAENATLRAENEELDFLRHEGGPDSVAAMETELATLRAERDAMTERATDAELNWTNCTRLAQRLRASEAAALEALAEIGVVVAALEGKGSLDREMIRNIGTRIAALTPTADKEPK